MTAFTAFPAPGGVRLAASASVLAVGLLLALGVGSAVCSALAVRLVARRVRVD